MACALRPLAMVREGDSYSTTLMLPTRMALVVV